MFPEPLDGVLDFIAISCMALAVYYIFKLEKSRANPVMMLLSPLVLYKYLVFLVSLVVAFVAVDIVADEFLHDTNVLIYGFEFGLASGSFGIMMITRRVYEQVAHPEKEQVKRQLRKELDDVMRRPLHFKEKQFRSENR